MSGVWKPARQKYGVAICNFTADSLQHALPLSLGDTVHILEEYWPNSNTDIVTWLRGCTFSNRNKKGIFPYTYIAFMDCKVEHEGPFETVTPVEDAVITELIFVLREWNARFKTLFVERKQLFQTILAVMGELTKVRSQLSNPLLSREKALELKHDAITMIDWGNSQLGLDLVPRVEYQQADPEKLSVVDMFRIHEQSVKNCQTAWPGGMVKVVKAGEKQNEKVFHLLLSLCSLGCDIGDNAEVYLSLYDSNISCFISERCVMHFSKDRSTDGNDKSTIFTDLVADEMRRDIYLVVQIFRKGRLTTEGNYKKPATYQYRRPWGVSGEVRNDLYLSLLGADFDRGSKTASKNIEARVSVYNQNYEIIKDCILQANGDQMCSSYFSYVLYHSNTPKWHETVRLSIPIDKFNGAHIRIELCHCSNRDKAEKKMYGFAFLPLTVNGTVAREDGKHDLCIYKCDDAAKIRNYLRLPYVKEENFDSKSVSNDHSPYQCSVKECLSVGTFLCSSKFAQKTELLNVLQWRSNPTKIPQNLDNLIKLKGQELVRYLQDVLDALFDMLSAGEKEQGPFAMEIFQTLVHIFYLLHDDMFEKFSEVLEDYLQKSFSSPFAHRLMTPDIEFNPYVRLMTPDIEFNPYVGLMTPDIEFNPILG
ncbi:Dedicator of cytokinesis protein 3 [Bulinus truncatus]|nr:Dedicator of cytokinesis protein 3 [Bulinus truncatus]